MPWTSFGTSRRRFVDWLLGTSLGGLILSVLYPFGRYVIPPASAEAATASVTPPFAPEEVPPNTGRIFKFGSRPGIVVRTPTGELRAFSAVCTHLACTVQYREDLSHIWCACHNGHYDHERHQHRGATAPPSGALHRQREGGPDRGGEGRRSVAGRICPGGSE